MEDAYGRSPEDLALGATGADTARCAAMLKALQEGDERYARRGTNPGIVRSGIEPCPRAL